MATVLDQLVVDLIFKGSTKELDKFEQGVKNLNQQLNKVARGFAVAGAALTATLVGVAKVALTHEQAVNNLRVLNKLTEEQIALLEEQAQEEGREGRFDSKDVLAAQHELIRAGWDHNQVLDEMTHIIAFATAGELDLAIAAQQVVGQLGQMDLEASGTEQAVNFMGKAFQNSNVALGNFSRLTQSVNENARQAGFSIEEITAASLHLGKEAGGASRAFQTAFADMEMVLKELLDLTPEGAEILRRLHIDPKDVGAIGLPEFLRRVAKLSKEQLQEVFGTEYWSKIGELTGSSDIEAIGELHRNLTTDMEGTIQAMADLKNQGAPGAWEDLKSAINALNVSLGKAGILFLLEHAFNALRKFIDAITNAPGPVRTVIAAIISMGPALLAIGAGLKLVTFGLSGLVPLLKAAAWANKQFGISTTFAAIANSKFVVSLKATRIGMLLTGATARVMWASITGPIGIAVALIGILVYKFRRQILGALKTVWKWVKGNWPLLVGILLGPFGIAGALIWKFRRQIFGVFTSIKKFFARVWGSIVGIFQDHWDKALAILFPAVGLPLLIARNWGRIVDAVDGVWSRVNNTVRGWIDAMVAFISELPGRVLDIVKDIPGMVADAIRDIPGLGGAIKVFTGLSDKVGGFFGKEKENFDKGGIVPGPTGRPMLATVHGGEMIIPPSAGQMLLDMFQGFKLGAAGLPTPSPGAATIYRQSISNRPTVNMGDITINITTSPGADSGEIAEDVAQNIADAVDKAIGKTFRDIAHDFDGPIER